MYMLHAFKHERCVRVYLIDPIDALCCWCWCFGLVLCRIANRFVSRLDWNTKLAVYVNMDRI